jgi:hypothetical protein
MFDFVIGVACGVAAARYIRKYGITKLPPKAQAFLADLNAKVW